VAELARLKELLGSPKIRALNDEYERNWGAVDFSTKFAVRLGQDQNRKTITLINFQPFLARQKKQPYPVEIGKLGCITNGLGECRPRIGEVVRRTAAQVWHAASQSGDHERIKRGIVGSLGAADARGGIAERTHQGIRSTN